MFYQAEGIESRTKSGTLQNEKEASAVVYLVEELKKKASQNRDAHWDHVDRLRIITSYQSQVVLIERMLRRRGLNNGVVATVDSSQGSEADVVILS
mmetsp:Transcript_1852/g.3643  ORF Transcript_1852/g.3643 Transcript_1852/m.3643 type:complete len:96 (+) Transcript_1852:728-1015(+)